VLFELTAKKPCQLQAAVEKSPRFDGALLFGRLLKAGNIIS
jgi:hypothetical protein